MLPPTLYFLVVLQLVAYTRSLLNGSTGDNLITPAAAAIGALIVGKSILIADTLPVWHLLDHQRKVYLVLTRTLCYALISLMFQVIEEILPLVGNEGSLEVAASKLLEEIHWHRFWATHILLVVFLVIFNTFAVVIEALGRDRFISLMFDRPSQGNLKGEL